MTKSTAQPTPAAQPIPTPGRIVLYRLSADDVLQIRTRRSQGYGAARGNGVAEGDTFPMLLVRVHGSAPDSYVNGQVFLDGPDTLWVTSVKVGEGPRTFSWPSRT
jgi:hypothetical protein